MRHLKNSLLRLILGVSLFALQLPLATAAQDWTAQPGTVKSIVISFGMAVVVTEPQGGNVCPGGIDGWYFWPADTAVFSGHKEQYALALSAYLTGRKIKFWINDQDCFAVTTGASGASLED